MKTVGIHVLMQMKFDCYHFTGEWLTSFGEPEKNFSALIYGESGNGKTDFCVKLAKYLAQFAKVLYFSAEEGISTTIQEAFDRNGMHEVSGRVILAEKANVEELIDYLKRRNSPQVVVLDSLDYMRLTTEQYKLLRATFPRKTFIIVSWSAGDRPKSQAGKDIEYMSDVKIRVKHYLAHPRSRYGGNAPFVIWDEKARKLNPPPLFTAQIEKREAILEQEDAVENGTDAPRSPENRPDIVIVDDINDEDTACEAMVNVFREGVVETMEIHNP